MITSHTHYINDNIRLIKHYEFKYKKKIIKLRKYI